MLHHSEGASSAEFYPDDLTPEIQRALAALADIEARYETDRDRLDAWSGPESVKRYLSAQIEERHAEERAPVVQRLAELHQRMTDLTMFKRMRFAH